MGGGESKNQRDEFPEAINLAHREVLKYIKGSKKELLNAYFDRSIEQLSRPEKKEVVNGVVYYNKDFVKEPIYSLSFDIPGEAPLGNNYTNTDYNQADIQICNLAKLFSPTNGIFTYLVQLFALITDVEEAMSNNEKSVDEFLDALADYDMDKVKKFLRNAKSKELADEKALNKAIDQAFNGLTFLYTNFGKEVGKNTLRDLTIVFSGVLIQGGALGAGIYTGVAVDLAASLIGAGAAAFAVPVVGIILGLTALFLGAFILIKYLSGRHKYLEAETHQKQRENMQSFFQQLDKLLFGDKDDYSIFQENNLFAIAIDNKIVTDKTLKAGKSNFGVYIGAFEHNKDTCVLARPLPKEADKKNKMVFGLFTEQIDKARTIFRKNQDDLNCILDKNKPKSERRKAVQKLGKLMAEFKDNESTGTLDE